MSDKLGELLAKARDCWRECRRANRDGALQTGRYIHQYLVEFLKQGDTMTFKERLQLGLSREKGVKRVSEELGLSMTKVYRMVVNSMVVDLLGDPGKLSYSTLKYFGILVRRPSIDWRAKSSVVISEMETWEVNPDFAPASIDLYRRATEEGWSAAKAIIDVAALTRKNVSFSKDKQRQRGQGHKHDDKMMWERERQTAITKGSPGDVANAVYQMVMSSSDPWAVAQRLLGQLSKIGRNECA